MAQAVQQTQPTFDTLLKRHEEGLNVRREFTGRRLNSGQVEALSDHERRAYLLLALIYRIEEK